jgi:hypothetical protein
MTQQTVPFLKRRRLSGIFHSLDIRNQQAIEEQWTCIEFLARLLEDEVERRAQNQLALRICRAAINTTKTLEGFDFAFNPHINRRQVFDLTTRSYIRQKRNVLIRGPTGVGKARLAQALAHEACRRGYIALFINTYKMPRQIQAGQVYVEYLAGEIGTTLAHNPLNLMFRNVAYEKPNTYVALVTAAVGDGDTGWTISEPSGGGYARVQVNPNGGSSPTWDLAADGLVDNTHLIRFPAATASWGRLSVWRSARRQRWGTCSGATTTWSTRRSAAATPSSSKSGILTCGCRRQRREAKSPAAGGAICVGEIAVVQNVLVAPQGGVTKCATLSIICHLLGTSG